MHIYNTDLYPEQKQKGTRIRRSRSIFSYQMVFVCKYIRLRHSKRAVIRIQPSFGLVLPTFCIVSSLFTEVNSKLLWQED